MRNVFASSHLMILFMILLASCGSLKLSPEGCLTNGLWGTKAEANSSEESFSEDYYVWNTDLTVKLHDFLLERKIECSEVKKLRVQIDSVFFVKRALTVIIQK